MFLDNYDGAEHISGARNNSSVCSYSTQDFSIDKINTGYSTA